MQQLAHLKINGEIIKVLVRSRKTGVSLKLRISGEDGPCMSDESAYLEEEPQVLMNLLNGKVVKC